MSNNDVYITNGGLIAHGDFLPTTLVWILGVNDLRQFIHQNLKKNTYEDLLIYIHTFF